MGYIQGVGGSVGAGPVTVQQTDSDVVQLGETKLSEVAERLGVSEQALLEANPQLQDPNRLSAGQVLQIPPGPPDDAGPVQTSGGDNTSGATAPVPTSPGKILDGQFGAAMRRFVLRADSQTPGIDLNQNNRQCVGPASPQTVAVPMTDAFKALPAATQSVLQNALKDPVTSSQLQSVVNSDAYNQLSPAQQTKVLNVFANADARGREGLPTLMNRQVVIGSGSPPPTMPALLSGDNSKAQTSLLDNLDKLANQPMSAAASGRRSEILGRVIEETGDPIWHLDQGNVGECAPTTLQTHLLVNTPSEYARLIGGLASPARSATLADGSKLDAATNDVVNNAQVTIAGPNNTQQTIPDSRSVTERMFQAAVQQYGDRSTGGPQNFDANTDQTGLWDNQVANVLHGMYNRNYTAQPAGGQGIGGAVGSNQAQRTSLYQGVLDQLKMHQGPVPVEVIWGNNANQGLHELMVTGVHNGRVSFRNPWGSRDAQGAGYKDGQTIAGPPPRRVDDSQGGLESMTVADFQKYINGAVLGPPVGGQ